MPTSLRELRMLRDVLLKVRKISSASSAALTNLLTNQAANLNTTSDLEREIRRLDKSISATNGMIAYYDRKIEEETEKGVLNRHMEEAAILCNQIRRERNQSRIPPSGFSDNLDNEMILREK
jgi:hypothetical protein